MFRWVLPAALSGMLALLACFPMRWAAGWVVPDTVKTLAPDLDMRGSIWRGTISGLPLFGSANLSIAPLARRVDFQSGEGGNYLAGIISPTEAADIDFRLDLTTVPFTDGRLQGLRGDFSAQISEMKISEQSCEMAIGTARTDVLQRNGGTIQWTGPELSGPIRCEDGALLVDLSGQDAQQTITAQLKLIPDGTYRADVKVRTVRVEADAVLPLFGFSRSGQSFVLTEQGKWR
ncbi:MAG: type II secretion system protein N [Litorimonas sp.]